MIALAIYYTLADIILLIQCLIYNRKNSTAVDPKHLSPATPLLEATDLWEEEDEPEDINQDLASSTGLDSASSPLLESGLSTSSKGKNATSQVSTLGSIMFNIMIVVGVFVTGFLGWYLSSSDHQPDGDDGNGDDAELQFDFWGQIFGYLCAVLYLGSRLPQILLNFERKSCDGISFLFFLFACLGNLTYVISILALGVTPRYLLVNASWLAGSVGTLLLDGVIFIQFWVYNGVDEEEDEDDEDEDEVASSTYQTI